MLISPLSLFSIYNSLLLLTLIELPNPESHSCFPFLNIHSIPSLYRAHNGLVCAWSKGLLVGCDFDVQALCQRLQQQTGRPYEGTAVCWLQPYIWVDSSACAWCLWGRNAERFVHTHWQTQKQLWLRQIEFRHPFGYTMATNSTYFFLVTSYMLTPCFHVAYVLNCLAHFFNIFKMFARVSV